MQIEATIRIPISLDWTSFDEIGATNQVEFKRCLNEWQFFLIVVSIEYTY